MHFDSFHHSLIYLFSFIEWSSVPINIIFIRIDGIQIGAVPLTADGNAFVTGGPIDLSNSNIAWTSVTNRPTAVSAFTNDSNYANVSYVDNSIANLVASAPETLNTLNELALALNSDAGFSTTVTNLIASKVDSSSLANVAFSGDYNDLSNTPPGFDSGNTRFDQNTLYNVNTGRMRIDPSNGAGGTASIVIPGTSANADPLEITNSNAGNVTITSSTNTWNFDSAGYLTTPSNLSIGQIQAPVDGTQIFQSANAWMAISSQRSRTS